MSAPFVRIVLLLLAWAAACCGPARADEAALTRRTTELRESPGDGARSLAALPAQAPVTRTPGRSGAWVQVRTASGASGWLHMFDLGPAAAPPPDAATALGGALRGVSNLLGGARPVQTGTTAGIRGLGAEDLARAHPNPYAVARMEALRQSEASVRSYAAGAAWQPVAVDPLPAPAPAAAAPAAPPAHPGEPAQLP